MKPIADQLPPEIAQQIHPDRRKNEEDYWVVRDQLLEQYQGQWIGFADGKVIASGSSPVAVFHAAEASGLHPFIICVGKEDQPSRIRRAAFPYDTSYSHISNLGLARRARISVPTASGLCRQGTHPGTRRPQSSGGFVSRPGW
jgi:Family of unknown function (DUF5678)